MKKLLIGCTLFLGGMIGISSIIIASLIKPEIFTFNDQEVITGLWGTITSNGSMFPMFIFFTLVFIGLYIMYKEYKNKE